MPHGLTEEQRNNFFDFVRQRLGQAPTYYQGGHDRSRRGTYRVNREEGEDDELLSRPGAQTPHLFNRRPGARTEYRPGDAPITDPRNLPTTGGGMLAAPHPLASDRTGMGNVPGPAVQPIKQLTPEEQAAHQQKTERLAEQSRSVREHRESGLEADRQYRADKARRRQQARTGVPRQRSSTLTRHENRQPTRATMPAFQARMDEQFGAVQDRPGFGVQNSEEFIAGSGNQRAQTPLPPPPQPPQSGGNDMAQSTRPGGYQSFGNPNNTPASQSGGVAMRGFGGSQAGGGLPPPPQGGGFTGGGQAGPNAQTAAGSPVNVRAPQAGGGFTGYQTLEQQQQNGPLGDIGRARINGLAGGQAPPPLPTLGGLPAGGARPTGIQPIQPGRGQPAPLPGGGYQRPAVKPPPMDPRGGPPRPDMPGPGGGGAEPLTGAPAGIPPRGGRTPAPTQDIYEPGQGAAQGGNMGGPPGPPVTQGGREPQLGAPAPINRVPGGVQAGGGLPSPPPMGGQQPGLGHAGPGGQPPVRPFPGAVGGGQQPPMPIRPIGGYGEGYGGTGGIQPPPPLSQVPPALQPFLPPGYGQRPQAPAPASAGPQMPQRPNIPPWFMR